MLKQFFDEASFTLTYLLVCQQTQKAVIIDPVDTQIAFYIQTLQQLGVTLTYALETHVHADHITASGQLRQLLGVQTGVSQACGASTANLQLNDGDVVYFGDEHITVLATPGHTAGSVSFLWRNCVFTGDSLLINGCGRTDFQGGDAVVLFDSIQQKLFMLADETLVYPAHDYNGKRVSNIAQEKTSNIRLAGKTKAEFIAMMQTLNLPKPKLIDLAVPANRKCGVTVDEVLQG